MQLIITKTDMSVETINNITRIDFSCLSELCPGENFDYILVRTNNNEHLKFELKDIVQIIVKSEGKL